MCKKRDNLISKYYPPSDSMELYDPDLDIYFNHSMEQLRDPIEYDSNQEGYTPFGDE